MRNAREFLHAVTDMKKEQSNAKAFKKIAIAAVIGSIVFAAVILIINLVGNEISKDTKPAETGVLKTIDGSLVKTDPNKCYATLLDLPMPVFFDAVIFLSPLQMINNSF